MIKHSYLKSFAEIDLEHRKVNTPLFDRVNTSADWQIIQKVITKNYQKGQSIDVRECYNSLILFKMLLLQTWYGLSDEAVEQNVLDR
jgi:IS5 family transposase